MRAQVRLYSAANRRNAEYRSLWIVRIGAAAREAGLTYSTLIHGLKLAGIDLDRKVLAETATADASQFTLLIEQAKTALANAAAATPAN